MPVNEVGWKLATDGNYYPPHVEIDDEWVERTDIEWAPEPNISPPPPLSERQRITYHQEWADALFHIRKITDGDLEIHVTTPWHVDPETGTLEVRILAFVNGELVDADNGRFQFMLPRPGQDICHDLLRAVRQVMVQ